MPIIITIILITSRRIPIKAIKPKKLVCYSWLKGQLFIKSIFSVASKPITSAGLERVLRYTEKSCIASYYRQFSQ